MKRKFNLMAGAVILAMLLTGCGSSTTSSQKDTSSSSSVKTAKQHSNAKKTAKQAASQSSQSISSSPTTQSSSSTQSSASQSSSTASSSAAGSTTNSLTGQTKSSDVNPTGSDVQRLTAFNQSMRSKLGKNVLLPTTSGLSTSNGHLNVRYSGNADSYTIYYSVGYTAKSLNDATLSSQIPYLVFNKKTYASQSAAAQAIRNYDLDTSGLATVDLGHGIKGMIDAGAGQRYLTWKEGKWQLTVHAAAVNGEDPLPTAQHIVALLEQYYLPAPDDRGTGTFEVSVGDGERPQVLTWMRGNVVYTMEAHSTDTLVQMAASLK
ncbi:hypothetical protein [uncultured Limosilactobacillus sp.]|uniref:hypothetical protein n=1 Tax=uncultured Limosilactobacillus sp. TaxID=2837629 RepID=UPI0025FE15B2|nr:hypothetical protein [uncultured Limosilactobacillus sp.]